MKNKQLLSVFALAFLLISLPNVLLCQIQTVKLPKPDFEKRITDAVNNIRIINTHEHIRPEKEMLEQKKEKSFDFTYLFQIYISDDLRSAGYNTQVQQLVNNKGLPLKDRWTIFEQFWNVTRNTGYAREVIITVRDLYGIDELNAETVEELSKKINDSCQPGWYEKVLKDKSGIELSILDIGHVKPDHDLFYHVERFDHFIHIFSALEIKELGKEYGIEVSTLDDYEKALEKAFLEGLDYGMIGVKNALAYNREIYYRNESRSTAEKIFNDLFSENKKPFNFEQVKPLQDYMMHRVLDLAGKHELPVQIHTGLHAGGRNEIRNSKPTLLTNLFHEYPNVNFCIFHSSYPYGAELSVLAKNYPNVFIDMCWTQIISPYYSERYLHEWLETVPANKIMAFGGDHTNVEKTYGHSVMARKVVAKVLTEKVAAGYFTEKEAIDIANRLLRENALEIFKLKGKTRDLTSLPSLSTKGDMHDLWEMVKTNNGLIRHWMVIGPFPIGTSHLTDEAPPGFKNPYPPEKEIDLKASYETESRNVFWRKVTTGTDGILDFKAMFPAGKAIVYAYSELVSPEEQKMKFVFSSDDGAKVWINGKLVYNVHAWRGIGWDGDFIEADLKKGKNSILVKVEDKWYNWEMMMRKIDMNGEVKVVEW